MQEIFISHGADGASAAKTLADAFARASIEASLRCFDAADDASTETVRAWIERSTYVVLIVTPGWAAASWPMIERYLASARETPVAVLAKLVLLDLSNGASVPAPLRPLLKSGLRLDDLRTLDRAAVVDLVAGSSGRRRRDSDTTLHLAIGGHSALSGEVFVLGHPGSGKSAFCALLKTRLAELDVPIVKIDAYSYLQVLFRIDQLRKDTTRFASDALSEFVIKDASVLDESVSLVKRRLNGRAAGGGVSIVELAFSEGQALADVIECYPCGTIVHVDASLEACRRRNAARGAILYETLRAAASSDEAFDRNSDIHHVPSPYYDRYMADPGRWEEGPLLLARRFADRYHRLENRNGDLQAYAASCRSFIETILLPGFDGAAYSTRCA